MTSTSPDTSKGVTEAMVEAALAAYSDGPYSTHEGKMWAALHAALASLSPPPAPEPTETRNEEFGFVEFINEDVPYIVREIQGHVAILLDMETRAVIGYRVYDPAKATGGIAELVGRLAEVERQRDEWKATHGRVVEGFMEVCEAVGVQFDAPEAVAYAINTKISNAEYDKRAAEAELAAMKEGAAVDGPEEIEIDRLRLAAFKTPSNENKAAYYLAVSKWFQDRHYRRLARPAPADKGVVECASEDCGQPATRYYAKHGVGSHHCEECYQRIVAIAASPPAEGDG